ncbi:MAG TPA: hypothetical protein VK549_06010 [Acidimicrobiia bacterium]|nr:hypothetical protein [Acidimicrobiia bacterium]
MTRPDSDPAVADDEKDVGDDQDTDAARAEDPEDDPEARLYTSEPLEAADGSTYVIQQQNVGPDNELGGGEWPSPSTPPRPPAPGAA